MGRRNGRRSGEVRKVVDRESEGKWKAWEEAENWKRNWERNEVRGKNRERK